jgi:hypothetical protein
MGADPQQGDFNLVRSQKENSNGNINFNHANNFNEWINKWGWLKLKILVDHILGPITKGALL